MLYVCLSFDYELFMGVNYVPEEDVLIKPTQKLMKALNAVDVSGTFFADVCCSMAYRNFHQNHFSDMFDEQLRDLHTNGQDVQLHIHPHWLKATRLGSQIEFERKYYRIHNWAGNNGDMQPVEDIIKNGVDYLNSVIKPIDESYKCIAFRAGGYCLQPEVELADILYRNGIRIDSSVCMGMAYDGSGMLYDYSNFPKHPRFTNIYIGNGYDLDGCNTTDKSRCVLEVPVGGYSKFPYRPVASKLNDKITNSAPRGYGMKLDREISKPSRNLIERMRQIYKSTNMLTFDFYNRDSMTYMLKRYAKENKNDSIISIITHPKALSDEHIDNIVNTVKDLRHYESVKFVSMVQVANMLGL